MELSSRSTRGECIREIEARPLGRMKDPPGFHQHGLKVRSSCVAVYFSLARFSCRCGGVEQSEFDFTRSTVMPGERDKEAKNSEHIEGERV